MYRIGIFVALSQGLVCAGWLLSAVSKRRRRKVALLGWTGVEGFGMVEARFEVDLGHYSVRLHNHSRDVRVISPCLMHIYLSRKHTRSGTLDELLSGQAECWPRVKRPICKSPTLTNTRIHLLYEQRFSRKIAADHSSGEKGVQLLAPAWQVLERSRNIFREVPFSLLPV